MLAQAERERETSGWRQDEENESLDIHSSCGCKHPSWWRVRLWQWSIWNWTYTYIGQCRNLWVEQCPPGLLTSAKVHRWLVVSPFETLLRSTVFGWRLLKGCWHHGWHYLDWNCVCVEAKCVSSSSSSRQPFFLLKTKKRRHWRMKLWLGLEACVGLKRERGCRERFVSKVIWGKSTRNFSVTPVENVEEKPH